MDEKKVMLKDDDLGKVNGGIEIRDDAQAGGRCPLCGTLLAKNSYGVFACPDCHPEQFDAKPGVQASILGKKKILSGGSGQKTSIYDRTMRNA